MNAPAIKHKKFSELTDRDFIYYINPFVSIRNPHVPLDELLKPTTNSKNQLIQAAKIKTITGIPPTGDIMKDIAYKTWVRITYFRPEPVLHAMDLNKIPTVSLDFNGERNLALTLVKLEDMVGDYPVPYCTDRGFLTAFIKSDYGRE